MTLFFTAFRTASLLVHPYDVLHHYFEFGFMVLSLLLYFYAVFTTLHLRLVQRRYFLRIFTRFCGIISRVFLWRYLYDVFMSLFLRHFYGVISTTFQYFYKFFNGVISDKLSRRSMALFLLPYYLGFFRSLFLLLFQQRYC